MAQSKRRKGISKAGKRMARIEAYKALRLVIEHKNVQELGFLGTDIYAQLALASQGLAANYPGILKAAKESPSPADGDKGTDVDNGPVTNGSVTNGPVTNGPVAKKPRHATATKKKEKIASK